MVSTDSTAWPATLIRCQMTKKNMQDLMNNPISLEPFMAAISLRQSIEKRRRPYWMWAPARLDLKRVQYLISGRWAIQVAEELPAAHVIGMDISPIRPARVPPNCEFKIGNLTKDLDTRREV